MRIGILRVGADAPGLNAAIRAIVRRATTVERREPATIARGHSKMVAIRSIIVPAVHHRRCDARTHRRTRPAIVAVPGCRFRDETTLSRSGCQDHPTP
jgi:hypothetical protein